MEERFKSSQKPLIGRVAIISGGAGDIGSAVALELAQRGADIAIGDLKDQEEVKEVLERISTNNVRTHYTQIDVSDYKAVKNWVSSVENSLGTPGIIIPCAGQATIEDMQSITPEEWHRELDVNLTGAFYLAREAANRLIEHKLPGNIIFIGSFAGLRPQVHNPAYSVSKAGVHALAELMALEFSPHGILVNAVAPGNVNAGLSRRYYEKHPEDLERDIKVIPARRLVEVDELAWHIANLCDPRNKNITGAIIPIDGGMSSLPDFRHYRKD